MKLNHRWCLQGILTREILTKDGQVLVHDNPRELEFLFGLKDGKSATVKVVEVSAAFLRERPFMRLRDHPELAATTFPLDPAEFRDWRK